MTLPQRRRRLQRNELPNQKLRKNQQLQRNQEPRKNLVTRNHRQRRNLGNQGRKNLRPPNRRRKLRSLQGVMYQM